MNDRGSLKRLARGFEPLEIAELFVRGLASKSGIALGKASEAFEDLDVLGCDLVELRAKHGMGVREELLRHVVVRTPLDVELLRVPARHVEKNALSDAESDV